MMRYSALGRAHILRTLLLVGLVVCPLFAASRHVSAAASGTWKEQVLPGPVAIDLPVLEEDCPSVSVCYALRGIGSGSGAPHPVLQKTVDGGATWTAQQLNVNLSLGFFPVHLACPGVDRCYLLASAGKGWQPNHLAIRVTADGGRTWTNHRIGITGELAQISCPSETVCYVSAFVYASASNPMPSVDLLRTRDGGQTWRTIKLPISVQPLSSLVCPGIDDCYLSGFLLHGARSNAPAKGLKGVAATHDGGRTWRVRTVAGSDSPGYSGLTCLTVIRCYAVGDAGLATTDDGGKTWRRLPARNLPATPSLTDATLVCSGVRVCYLAMGQLWRTTDGGMSWTAESSASSFGVRPLACPGASTCYGANSSWVLVKKTDGESWQEITPRPLGLDAIACPDPGTCYAVGYSGEVLTTTDGGITWVRRSTGTDVTLQSVTCPDLGVCLAFGNLHPATATGPQLGTPVLLRTADGGQTWQQVSPPKKTSWGPALSCPASAICFDAGSVRQGTSTLPDVLRSVDGGRTWSAVGTLPKGYGLGNLACATTTRCVGVGGIGPCIDDLARRYQSRQKTVLRSAQDTYDCQERGWLFDTTDGGRHWRRDFNRTLKPYDLLGAYLLTTACPTPSQCYAAGYGLWARSTHGGQRWAITSTQFPGYAPAPGIDSGPTDFIQSLSCTDVSSCWGIAVHVNSFAGAPVVTTDGGRHWRAVDAGVPLPDQYFQGGLAALACPSSNTCFAVGGDRIMAYSP